MSVPQWGTGMSSNTLRSVLLQLNMTRKDYIVIAGALERSKPMTGLSESSLYQLESWTETVLEIDRSLARDNERFNSTRFLSACGLTQHETNNTEEEMES